MKHKLIYSGIAAFVLLFFGVAQSLAHEVTLASTATLGGGPSIDAGTYRLEVIKNEDSSHAVFYKDDGEVVRAPVTLVAEDSKARQTEIHSSLVDGQRVITQIRLRGASERLVFEKAAGEKSGGE